MFNGREWRDIAIDPALAGEDHREERERLYVKLFFDQVIGDRHRRKCYCEVRAKHRGPIKYWLVHASDDLKPYTLMNDEIVKVNEILLEREYRDEGMLEEAFVLVKHANRLDVHRRFGGSSFASFALGCS